MGTTTYNEDLAKAIATGHDIGSICTGIHSKKTLEILKLLWTYIGSGSEVKERCPAFDYMWRHYSTPYLAKRRICTSSMVQNFEIVFWAYDKHFRNSIVKYNDSSDDTYLLFDGDDDYTTKHKEAQHELLSMLADEILEMTSHLQLLPHMFNGISLHDIEVVCSLLRGESDKMSDEEYAKFVGAAKIDLIATEAISSLEELIKKTCCSKTNSCVFNENESLKAKIEEILYVQGYREATARHETRKEER